MITRYSRYFGISTGDDAFLDNINWIRYPGTMDDNTSDALLGGRAMT